MQQNDRGNIDHLSVTHHPVNQFGHRWHHKYHISPTILTYRPIHAYLQSEIMNDTGIYRTRTLCMKNHNNIRHINIRHMQRGYNSMLPRHDNLNHRIHKPNRLRRHASSQCYSSKLEICPWPDQIPWTPNVSRRETALQIQIQFLISLGKNTAFDVKGGISVLSTNRLRVFGKKDPIEQKIFNLHWLSCSKIFCASCDLIPSYIRMNLVQRHNF